MITVHAKNISFYLRPWQESDLASLVKYAGNVNIFNNMTDSFPHPYTQEAGKQFITRATQNKPENILAIVVNGEACGSIGFFPETDVDRLNAEFGYWLGEPFWGKGIATAAVQAVTRYAFENFPLTRLFARPFEHNIASQKVLENAGFILEARIPKCLIKNGVIMDELIYAIRKEDAA